MTSSLYGADLFSADAARDEIAIRARYAARKKRLMIGMTLLVMLGPLGTHRFYIGRVGSACAMFLSTAVSVACLATGMPAASSAGAAGLLAVAAWCLVELGLLRRLVDEYNRRLLISLGY